MSENHSTKSPELILASGSPRRLELLRNLGLKFTVIPSDIDESTDLKDPVEIVKWLSLAKAEEVAARLPESDSARVVLGADTIVVLDSHVLGKPQSAEDALAMLKLLSGKAHKVYTGVSIVELPGNTKSSIFQESTIYFRQLSDAEAEYYASSAEPMDKAGAYALQGAASAFVERLEGCYSNVIGLPVPDTVQLLRQHGVEVMGSTLVNPNNGKA